MKRKGIIFIVASIGIISSVWAIKRGNATPPKAPLLVEPTQKPFPRSIAASGIVEAAGENIMIGSPENGIVQEVFVKVHDRVAKGDPLFKLDTRELESELKVAEAKEVVAKAEYDRIQDQLTRIQSIKDQRAISQEELRSKENERAIAAATVMQAQNEKEKVAVLLDRLTIRSPIDGTVLQKNIRPGEFIVATNNDNPPLVIGNTTQFQIRADIDEHNLSDINPLAEATAYPKNQPNNAIPLTFLRIEPFVVPKRSLTGLSKEKVDTRVLQVIYTFKPPTNTTLYVGSQVDVYIQRSVKE
jgi:RND family efflux transporter MFP subunit